MNRLQTTYKEQVAGKLAEEFKLENPMAIPRLTKVVVSVGLGSAIQDKKRIPASLNDIAVITGQKPKVCRARKSVSNFKLREGYEIGVMATLRGRRMYEFLDRLINVAIPRMRDFRGVSATSFDGRGNYSMGVTDQTIFPEINMDALEYRQGMNITIVTTAPNDAQSRRLLELLGMPFRRAGQAAA